MFDLFWSKHAASFVLSQSNRVGRGDRAHAESTRRPFIYLISVKRIFLAPDEGYDTNGRLIERAGDTICTEQTKTWGKRGCTWLLRNMNFSHENLFRFSAPCVYFGYTICSAWNFCLVTLRGAGNREGCRDWVIYTDLQSNRNGK